MQEWDSSKQIGRRLLILLAGLALLIVGFDVLPDLSAWTLRWGVIPVYLVYFLLMSIAARLFWSGADPLIATAKATLTAKAANRRQPNEP